MSGFYITKLTVSGTGMPDSDIVLRDGVNIIYGPSNTGKTYVIKCIDYLFGSDTLPIEGERDYDTITMHIASRSGGECGLRRRLSERQVEIIGSTIDEIQDGIYKITSDQFKRLYLSLIGIKEPVQLIAKQDYTKTQRLSWRMLESMFFIKEEHIFRSDSIITYPEFNNITAALSALKYCYDGKQIATPDLMNGSAIGKREVATYIARQMDRLRSEQEAMEQALGTPIYANIDELLDAQALRLETLHQESQRIGDKENELLQTRIEISDRLRELSYMQERFVALSEGYRSDMERLRFIIDGEEHRPELPHQRICPFCRGDLNPVQHRSLAPAARKELHVIETQWKELASLINANSNDMASLEEKLQEIYDQQTALQEEIDNTYKPQIRETQELIHELEEYQQKNIRLTYVREIRRGLDSDLQELVDVTNQSVTYNARSLLGDVFYERFDQCLDEILRFCNYDAFQTCHLSRSEFDIVIDGKKKRNQGKGYRAFLNTVMAYTILKVLSIDGVCSPGMLVLDSPILSLKERDEQTSAEMKENLFRLMLRTEFPCQIIVVENEIPGIDYTGANMIHFTKDCTTGRYGFLQGTESGM